MYEIMVGFDLMGGWGWKLKSGMNKGMVTLRIFNF